MELDVYTIIRQKVKAAEATPVTWRKDRVWEQIDLTVPQRSRKVYYYAAAGVLIATFTALYLLQLNQQARTQDKINSLAAAIHENMNRQKILQDLARQSTQEQDCPNVERIASAPKITKLVPSTNPEKELVTTSVSINPAPENISTEVAVRTDEVVIQEQPSIAEIAPDVPQVKAIIGYIPPKAENIAIIKKTRKTKMRFLKAPDPEFASQAEERKWVTARIN